MQAELSAARAQNNGLTYSSMQIRKDTEHISARIQELQTRKSQIQGTRKTIVAALITGSFYTDSAKQELQTLEQEIARLRASIPSDDTWIAKRELQDTIKALDKSIAVYERALISRDQFDDRLRAKKESQKQRAAELRAAAVIANRTKREAQKQQMEELRAAVASVNETKRDLAAKLRPKMPRQDYCPYCGGLLGDDLHQDHIYPVSKGGHSTERNLVFVCAACNKKKSDLTLAAFIQFYGLDRDTIENKLRAMGKDF